MKATVTAIIQARMGSSRLPGKAILDLAGRPLLYHVFRRIQATPGVDRIVMATCHGSENDVIIRLAESMGILVFIGSEDNVLERFYLASERYGGDYIMRVTGDNPFTDPGYAAETIRTIRETGADLCYFPNLPLGTGVGMLTKAALDAAYRLSDQPYQREHVTPYIKEHPERFRIHVRDIALDNPHPNLRLTVDTAEDYEVAQKIYAGCYHGEPFPLGDVLRFIEKNPDIPAINSGIQQRPMTHSSTK
ncbi:MAG TPA: glycosyltransferase family protein [Spirochaetota bacterium]|nr:glycosyltransferase family protein [Spirochaetota bacterium]HPC39410.1 glycosyltransferase family protein [Spirochaetota bacterium]HPL17294.1 glycosyltransferase family protein [Spirochaetota bacterium]HQF06747.1 glycosyltransferase family protein [Spirochaetota bacterium]HQH95634.1 glycosyltransferase family protein [Spirochaetota bacterium]